MPKLKTRKALTRRFKITKTGKILRGSSFGRHLKATKSSKRLRGLKKTKLLTGHYAKKVRRALGIKRIK